MSASRFSLSIIILLLSLNTSWAKEKTLKCFKKKNVLCQAMIKLSPKMDPKLAYKLSNYFHHTALKYQVPSQLLVAIAFQESAFKLDTVRRVSGFIFDEDLGYQKVKVGADFCMMQINIRNIQKMNLDVEQLLNDPKYCIEAGAQVLSRYKKKHHSQDAMWWAYYNAKNKYKREIYHRLVSRHLNKMYPSQSETDKPRSIASNETELEPVSI